MSMIPRSLFIRGGRQTMQRSFHASPVACSNYHPIGQVSRDPGFHALGFLVVGELVVYIDRGNAQCQDIIGD